MKLTQTTALLAAVAGLASAQVSDIPTCALGCFSQAIGKSGCDLMDYVCQCTEGAEIIGQTVVQCLCESESCSDSETKQISDASNGICSSALEAESMTYTPASLPTDCSQLSSGGGMGGGGMGSMSSMSMSSSMAMPTGGSGSGSDDSDDSDDSDSDSDSSDSDSDMSASASAPPATPTNAAAPNKVGFTGAAAGLAGIALFAL